jgi:hypothetical protein
VYGILRTGIAGMRGFETYDLGRKVTSILMRVLPDENAPFAIASKMA